MQHRVPQVFRIVVLCMRVKTNRVLLNRKMLSQLVILHPTSFNALTENVK